MLGNNKMQFNEAMMILIVQEWLNRNFVPEVKPVVKSVKREGSGYDTWFEIGLSEAEDGK